MPNHRKLVKHFHEPGDLHEFTFSCFQQRPLLTNDSWRSYLADSIDVANERYGFQLIAFVFMPEHVHLLTLPLDDEPAISTYLAAVKRPVSAHIKADLVAAHSPLLKSLTIQERPGKMTFRYWQEGPGYDRNLRSEKVILRVIDYIHANPVRRGLCQRPEGWRWSSARWFAADGLQPDSALPKLTSSTSRVRLARRSLTHEPPAWFVSDVGATGVSPVRSGYKPHFDTDCPAASHATSLQVLRDPNVHRHFSLARCQWHPAHAAVNPN
jgi:putative transposase